MALAAGMTGCKHKPYLTPIPNGGGPPQATTPANPSTGVENGGAVNPTPPPISTSNIPLDTGRYTPIFETGNKDPEKFRADTIYFDFDSTAIKASEQSKLQEVATYFKDNARLDCLLIEGNCDERGTEKYNLSLGERRALAAREYLANLGVDPARIKTVTYGASRPAEPGHNEEAWKKNRRDDFILVTPK